MRRALIMALSLILGISAAAGCNNGKNNDNDVVTPGVTIKTKIQDYRPEATNGIAYDSMGRKTFAAGNEPVVVWGVENDQWGAVSLSRSKFDEYVEASLNINANAIAIHMPWAVLEQQEGIYSTGATSYLKYCVDKAREAGLKIVVYFTSTNYASGDGTFLPSYIVNDKERFTRLYIAGVYDGNSVTTKSDITLCVNNAALLERELLAINKLMTFIKSNNEDGIFTAINICSEFDYTRNWPSGGSINHDVRCECDKCNSLFRSAGHEEETPFEFMQRSYYAYQKALIDEASRAYPDLAIYSPVAALTWFDGGRYVEQPRDIYEAIQRENFFVCPSIAPTQNYALFEAEMSYFVDIEGNAAFASGIDTGWTGTPFNNQVHLELAPWYSILEYGGLGAIYWDYPQSSDPSCSVLTKDAAITERLRIGWAPLKAAEYYISRFKGDEQVLNWWGYHENKKQFDLGDFTVSVNRSEENFADHANYGIAMLMDDRDLVIASTAYEPNFGENNDINVVVKGNPALYKFETGYFNGEGEWVKSGTFTPAVKGNTITVSVKAGNGDYRKSCYRIYK